MKSKTNPHSPQTRLAVSRPIDFGNKTMKNTPHNEPLPSHDMTVKSLNVLPDEPFCISGRILIDAMIRGIYYERREIAPCEEVIDTWNAAIRALRKNHSLKIVGPY
jgi:hypothetical protein